MKKLILSPQEKAELLKQATKLKIEFEAIHTWLWTAETSELTPEQIKFLDTHEFLYSKSKKQYFLKGSDAVDNYGHYNPISYEKLREVYGTRRVYSRNYKKLIPKL